MTSQDPADDNASEDLATRRKRLYFRSWHRGIKEADILLGNFADKYLASLTADQLDRYEDLIQEQDVDIIAWITGSQPPPKRFDTDVMQLLQKLDYVELTS
ncbi:MAG: succinate dehydrogenase assembly factor 2 [Alphaproteobacteria bacterium]|nr:MAG: succinate dehydrogenase assembly factor 2 [Alphaproteobacteria bacterium]